MKNRRKMAASAPLLAALTAAAVLLAAPAWGAFGEDLEKPAPEFTRSEDHVAAKLIPRGKRTSIRVDFAVEGGRLVDVQGLDFDEVRDATVDSKDFRSAMFIVKVNTGSIGAEARVSLSSAYFTRSTELWVCNPKGKPAWRNGRAENLDRADRVRELVLTVKDGGVLDSDGRADGEITLMAGPMDSFWGYALGTLFIRFFGIFIVLGLLQIGMRVSGAVFQRLDARRANTTPKPPATPRKPGAGPGEGLDPETAAAIGLALRAHLASRQERSTVNPAPPAASGWTQEGRGRLMGERLQVFHRSRGK